MSIIRFAIIFSQPTKCILTFGFQLGVKNDRICNERVSNMPSTPLRPQKWHHIRLLNRVSATPLGIRDSVRALKICFVYHQVQPLNAEALSAMLVGMATVVKSSLDNVL